MSFVSDGFLRKHPDKLKLSLNIQTANKVGIDILSIPLRPNVALFYHTFGVLKKNV